MDLVFDIFAFLIIIASIAGILQHLHIPITYTDILIILVSILGILVLYKLKKWKIADNIGAYFSLLQLIGATIINILCLVFGAACAYFGFKHPLLLLKGESQVWARGWGPMHGYSAAIFGVVVVLLIVAFIYFSIANHNRTKKR